MSLTSRAFGERGRKRAIKLGIDPKRLPPGQSPTAPGKWPVLTVGAAPVVAPEEWKLFVYGEVAEDRSFTLADLRPLAHEHGGPVRLLVPQRYFWKSAKYLQAIELLDHDEPDMSRPPTQRLPQRGRSLAGGTDERGPLRVPGAAPPRARRVACG
jgi:DMSO/TMAO reductase YedYZ molybdopterin-dependent catalytic subunit